MTYNFSFAINIMCYQTILKTNFNKSNYQNILYTTETIESKSDLFYKQTYCALPRNLRGLGELYWGLIIFTWKNCANSTSEVA